MRSLGESGPLGGSADGAATAIYEGLAVAVDGCDLPPTSGPAAMRVG